MLQVAVLIILSVLSGIVGYICGWKNGKNYVEQEWREAEGWEGIDGDE